MQIEDKDVLHIAKLARLKLADNELESYKKNLQEILDFADTINHVNTDDIGETIGINENYNVFRKDEIVQDSDKDELLANNFLGYGEKHPKIDDFLGNYIAIAIGSSIIKLETNISKIKANKKSTHCGLTPEEMEVPLIFM